MERKRVHYKTETKAAGQNSALTYTIDESNGVNAHNVHVNFICEPQDADANAHGSWVLWCLPDAVSSLPSGIIAVLEVEGSNQFLWASGLWSASNQTPFTLGDTSFRTTRNCANGSRLILQVTMEGVSAGVVRIDTMLTANTKSL